jgi:hypothetical protein
MVTLERRIDSAAAAEVDELIAQATEAVRSAMDAAPSDALLLAACEAIAAARGRIELLEGPPRESQAAARAFTRKHKAARLLFERLRRAT